MGKLGDIQLPMNLIGIVIGILVLLVLIVVILGPVIVGSDEIAIVEKKFSRKQLEDGKFIALDGEAGYQGDVLRTGLHFKTKIIYRIHKCPLITIKQGKIGYVFARSGEALETSQTLARVVECDNFQNTRKFFENGGQKGPQRAILREGTYYFNLAQFIVITEDGVSFLPVGDKAEIQEIEGMAKQIASRRGFEPVVIADHDDLMGIVVTMEGKQLKDGDLIAPIVGDDESDSSKNHNGFQNIEAFLAAGGYRGRQLGVLTEGTYFINRLFATVELCKKTEIGVSYVGVVNSYVGQKGSDISGESYTHGDLVEEGCKGIWAIPLSPGKYAWNKYAGEILPVPTDNFALKWIDGERGQYDYDEHLRELSVITKDGFQPLLPLSVVVHINYKEAPLMIQRFGSVKKLVEQTLDPIISSHFKAIAETKTFLEIVQNKAGIAAEVMERMTLEFHRFNLELEDVLIDTPKSNGDTRIDKLIEQLSTRQIATEQIETYNAQIKASSTEKELREKQASADKQSDLTNSQIQIQIQENAAEAELLVAKKKAEQLEVETSANAAKIKKLAEAEAEKMTVLSEAEATKIKNLAEAEAQKEEEVGKAIAEASKKQVEAYGGAQLLVQKNVLEAFANAIKEGGIPIVPQNYIGSNDTENGMSGLSQIFNLVALEKLGVDMNTPENKITIKQEKQIETKPTTNTDVVDTNVLKDAVNNGIEDIKKSIKNTNKKI